MFVSKSEKEYSDLQRKIRRRKSPQARPQKFNEDSSDDGSNVWALFRLIQPISQKICFISTKKNHKVPKFEYLCCVSSICVQFLSFIDENCYVLIGNSIDVAKLKKMSSVASL